MAETVRERDMAEGGQEESGFDNEEVNADQTE